MLRCLQNYQPCASSLISYRMGCSSIKGRQGVVLALLPSTGVCELGRPLPKPHPSRPDRRQHRSCPARACIQAPDMEADLRTLAARLPPQPQLLDRWASSDLYVAFTQISLHLYQLTAGGNPELLAQALR